MNKGYGFVTVDDAESEDGECSVVGRLAGRARGATCGWHKWWMCAAWHTRLMCAAYSPLAFPSLYSLRPPDRHPERRLPFLARGRAGEHFAGPAQLLPLPCTRPSRATRALRLARCYAAQVEFDTVETDRGVQASNVTGVGGVPLDRTRMDYAEEEEH